MAEFENNGQQNDDGGALLGEDAPVSRWSFVKYGAAAGLGALALAGAQPAYARTATPTEEAVAPEPTELATGLATGVATEEAEELEPTDGATDEAEDLEPTDEATDEAEAPDAKLLESDREVLDVYINEGYLKMVDDSLVYFRGFGDRPTEKNDANPSLTIKPKVFLKDDTWVDSRIYPVGAPEPPRGTPTPLQPDPENAGQYLVRRAYWGSFMPERVIVAEKGSKIKLRVHNRLAKDHELAIHGAGDDGEDVSTGKIAPGAVGTLELKAPEPGVYIYSDPGNQPVERTLGLYGALVVMDPSDAWCISTDGAEFERQWVWLCHSIDPVWANIEAKGGTVDPVRQKAVPRYFTLNGRSGYESMGMTRNEALNRAADEETTISGYPRQFDAREFAQGSVIGSLRGGQLVRVVNCGIVFHQMHFHGNHLWTVRCDNEDWSRDEGHVGEDGYVCIQQWEDVIKVRGMESKDAIIPIKRPPDAVDKVWDNRKTDWAYPMHCHSESSQTAAGGMYPGGLTSHWIIKAPLEGATS
ncbi:multicopper oxidase domain-containing protein [Arthrobacter crystallopoietes]|uniref:multicopper oxidase domain-containing protein n=1 Tax=Crystallibacter crystallopoietes TaxID=37928 RepID=UPI0011111422|nr:multicopper oxidase domain-containing protein [Arthrobacter crystallopoietes]QTG82032.1 multicopper oxidase domain-containing protein [Arthrobacter crystallopoietes]